MKCKVLKPCLGYKVGAVVEIANIGVAKTLVSFGNVVEVKDDDKLDSDQAVSTKRVASKSKRSKVTSKTKRKRHDSRQQSDASDGSSS